MMTLDQILDGIDTLPAEAKEKIIAHITEVSLPKNTILMKAGRLEKSIFFIKKGVVRAYSEHENGEITFWFGEEGETILSMKSYVDQEPGYENIQLIEECELYCLPINALTDLYLTDICIANWGRKLAEKELLKIENRLISRELLSARQRYDDVLTNRPSLLQRIPLKYIASYLGMTQVSLSRVRKEK